MYGLSLIDFAAYIAIEMFKKINADEKQAATPAIP